MKKWLIRVLGLRGSWSWACRQMDQGAIVRPAGATGSVKYKLDDLTNRRILWSFDREPPKERRDWDGCNIFLSDFERTDWVVVPQGIQPERPWPRC